MEAEGRFRTEKGFIDDLTLQIRIIINIEKLSINASAASEKLARKKIAAYEIEDVGHCSRIYREALFRKDQSGN
jgi:hypothetical protein